MGALHLLFDEVGYLEEGDFAFDEALHGHLVGGVHDAGHVSPAGDGVVGQLEAAEGAGVGFFEDELGIASPVEPGEVALYALGEAEGVLDGGFHGGDAELGFDAAVDVLYHGVDNGLGMDEHLDALGRDVEEPAGFDDFEAFVHEGGGVDGHFATHAPVGVVEGIGEGDVFELLAGVATEGTARGGEEYFVDIAHFAYQALEDGGVFGVDREDGHVVAGCGLGDDGSGHYHGLLVGEGDGFVVFDGTEGGPQAGKAYDGGQNEVDGVHLHEVGDGVHAGEDFDVVGVEGIEHLLVFGGVGDGHDVGVEFEGLLDE